MGERKTVEESKFNEDLGKIIKRDFYPNLDNLQTQKEYFQALEKNDVVKLRDLQMKMQSTSDPDNAGPFETPVSSQKRLLDPENASSSNPEPPKKIISADLHLDQYLGKFTSEDDMAISQLMNESELKKKQQRPWLYTSSEIEKEKSETLLALPDPVSQAKALGDQANRDLVTWKHTAQNTILFFPDGAPLSEKEKLAENAIRPRQVLYENTRFKVSTTIGVNRPSTTASLFANKLEGRIGIDGREVVTSQTPAVGGYKYVATPSPVPGSLGESPFMTWGQLDSTPVLVDPSSTPLSAPSFKIPDVPAREQLALDLADKVSRHNKSKKETALKAAADSVRRYASPSQRIASMSPAAQKLLVNRMGSGYGGSAYTPSPISSRTPSRTPGSSGSVIRLKEKVGTPSRSSSSLEKSNTKRAEDFF